MKVEYHPCFFGACRGTVRVVDGYAPAGKRRRIQRHDGVLVATAWICDLCFGLHGRITNPTLTLTRQP